MLSLISMITLSSCNWHKIHGNGLIKTETREVSAFEFISCDGSYEVQINCQEKQSLTIETDENLLPNIKTEVHNNTLRIYTKGFLLPSDKIRIKISIPNIEGFTANGSVDGNINNINNKSLDVNINGSGKLFLNGKSDKVDLNVSGYSKIDAGSVISDNVHIQINGSGNIKVYATNSIDVQINGTGTVRYKGEPKNVNQQINGSGSIGKD